MRTRCRSPLGAAALSATLAASCFAETPRPTRATEPEPSDSDLGAIDEPETGPVRIVEAADYAVQSVTPNGGTYLGGNVALIRGNGFSSMARIWFGDVEVPARDVLVVDRERIQVAVPPGAGEVDVTVQNGTDGEHAASLAKGYRYAPFLVEPAHGVTSGGGRLTLLGKGTSWDASSEVTIDLAPCPVTEFREEGGLQVLVCTTPAGTEGQKNVEVHTEDGAVDRVLGGFTYSSVASSSRAGLSGEELDGELRVIVLDAATELALEGASVVLGVDSDELQTTESDAQGVAQFSGALGPRQTVTAFSRCHHPTTFQDVTVSEVVVLLSPTDAPACTPEGDAPSVVMTRAIAGSTVTGQLVWDDVGEFQSGGWFNVPVPDDETKKRVAYVLELSPNPTQGFVLPRATQSVTPLEFVNPGYSFVYPVSAGNLSLYALAGVEDRSKSPPRFEPFVMGLTRGISAQPGDLASDVYIKMDIELDQRIEFELTAPASTSRGPDRLATETSVKVGSDGYLFLPHGTAQLPLADSPLAPMLGYPALDGVLRQASYVTRAVLTSGALETLPTSALTRVVTTNATDSVNLDGFVSIPRLLEPGENASWDGKRLELDEVGSEDLRVVDMSFTGGSVEWRIVSPSAGSEVRLPDLGTLLPLPRGAVTILVQEARLSEFDYATLTYEALEPRNWVAYAAEAFFVHYEP